MVHQNPLCRQSQCYWDVHAVGIFLQHRDLFYISLEKQHKKNYLFSMCFPSRQNHFIIIFFESALLCSVGDMHSITARIEAIHIIYIYIYAYRHVTTYMLWLQYQILKIFQIYWQIPTNSEHRLGQRSGLDESPGQFDKFQQFWVLLGRVCVSRLFGALGNVHKQ